MRESISNSFSQWIGMASDVIGSGSASSSSMAVLTSGSSTSGGIKFGIAMMNRNNTGGSSRRGGWRRLTPQKAVWGPTHSLSSSSSDNDEDGQEKDETMKLNEADPSHSPEQPNSNDYGNSGGEEKKFDVGDLNLNRMTTPPQTPLTKPDDAGQGTPSTKSSKEEDDDHDNTDQNNHSNINSNKNSFRRDSMAAMQTTLGRVWNNLQCMEDTTLWAKDETKHQRTDVINEGDATSMDRNNAKANNNSSDNNKLQLPESTAEFMDEICPSPFHSTNVNDVMALSTEEDNASTLGIARLLPPGACVNFFGNNKSRRNSNKDSSTPSISKGGDAKSTATVESAIDRRKERHKRRQERNSAFEKSFDDFSAPQEAYEVTQDQIVLVQTEPPKKGNRGANGTAAINTVASFSKPLPMESLTLNTQKAVELERSISELTMRSSYGEATAKIAENRRMAYYAVGRHHRQSGRGGNRRCYFTGKLILGGAPFYAGSVQQGLRTLVVFCLPSALGLPREKNPQSASPLLGGLLSGGLSQSRRPSLNSRGDTASVTPSVAHSVGNKSSLLSRKSSRLSRLSSIDDASMSVEEELDPNWELDRDYLLGILPDPDQSLLDEMALRYPQQFETLPVQVRSPHCWKLYVKFCFFSGLPIAEGELHYRVRDAVADQCSEEVILSHEVMEAVNGDSAEILRLPNLKTFRYLKRHYHQQSAKLPDSCFQRQAWEMVRCEV